MLDNVTFSPPGFRCSGASFVLKTRVISDVCCRNNAGLASWLLAIYPLSPSAYDDNRLGICSPRCLSRKPESMQQQSITPMRPHLWVDIVRVALYWSL